jgi:hypothetical protein
MIRGAVPYTLQVRLLDQEIVHEQLPADIDRNDFGWRGQVRRHDGMFVEILQARRPR